MIKRITINILLSAVFIAAMTAVTLPFSAQVKVNSARQLTRAGTPDEAQKAYEEALALAPMCSDYWVEYGDFLWDISIEKNNDLSWNKIEPAYRQATQVNPKCTRCWINRGHIAFANGEVDQAVDHFRQAKALDPNGGDTGFYLERAAKKLLKKDASYKEVAIELTGENLVKP